MSNLTINQKLIDDPFRVIYYKALETFEIHTLADRIEFLDRLADGIHQVENDIKNSSEQSQWLGIVSGFGAALTIGAFIAIPLIPVAILATMGTSSALVGIGNTVQRKLKLSPVQEDLERHYLALRSTTSINWASLWDYCHKTTSNGDESFLRLLFKASRGTIQGDRLIRFDSTKEPFIAANKALASLQGRQVDEIATFVRAIKESFLSQQEKPIDSGWVPMPHYVPDEPKQIIGSNTRLGAVEVPSQPATEQPKLLSFEQVLTLPLSARADYLMETLAQYGCDLRKLAGRPTLAAGGLQRSGKTTLILLLAILEKAKGQKIFYVTRDTDLYPIAFDGYASGSKDSAVTALMTLSDRINSGAMGGLSGETWILDEFSSTAKEMPEQTKSQFWSMALTGFAKQGGRVRFIVHHKTASANGLPTGEAETFKAEVKMFWTERAEMNDGTYQPSGQYELLAQVNGHYKETGETFVIPEWLKSDVNPAWHNTPCPVRSLLTFFPELDTRKGATAKSLAQTKASNPFQQPQAKVEPQTSTVDQLNRMLELPSADHEVDEDTIETVSSLSEIRDLFPNWKLKSLEVASVIIDWLRKKSGSDFAPSQIRSNIRKLKEDESLSTERLKNLLELLTSKGFLSESNGRYSIAQSFEIEDDYDF